MGLNAGRLFHRKRAILKLVLLHSKLRLSVNRTKAGNTFHLAAKSTRLRLANDDSTDVYTKTCAAVLWLSPAKNILAFGRKTISEQEYHSHADEHIWGIQSAINDPGKTSGGASATEIELFSNQNGFPGTDSLIGEIKLLGAQASDQSTPD